MTEKSSTDPYKAAIWRHRETPEAHFDTLIEDKQRLVDSKACKDQRRTSSPSRTTESFGVLLV
jgi:hypothetical protein